MLLFPAQLISLQCPLTMASAPKDAVVTGAVSAAGKTGQRKRQRDASPGHPAVALGPAVPQQQHTEVAQVRSPVCDSGMVESIRRTVAPKVLADIAEGALRFAHISVEDFAGTVKFPVKGADGVVSVRVKKLEGGAIETADSASPREGDYCKYLFKHARKEVQFVRPLVDAALPGARIAVQQLVKVHIDRSVRSPNPKVIYRMPGRTVLLSKLELYVEAELWKHLEDGTASDAGGSIEDDDGVEMKP